jgi:hypothetical protein
MCDGHDNVVIARRTTGRSRLPWRYAYWSARSFVRSSFGGIRERHASLRMSPLATATSVALTLSYVACMTFGEILTRLDPTLVPRRFSI